VDISEPSVTRLRKRSTNPNLSSLSRFPRKAKHSPLL